MSLNHTIEKQKKYLTEKDASVYLKASAKTLQRHRANATGPDFIKIHGRILYDMDDLDNYVQSHKFSSTSEYEA